MKKYFAPGRINLIGEHLDYNGGLVLPAAITLGITATYTPRSGNNILLRSSTHTLAKEIALGDEILFDLKNEWTNYPLGVIAQLQKENFQLPACEIIFESNLPEGAGLSSSAAIEVLTAFILLSQTEKNIDKVWLANFCKQVENEFIGVQCGIMDQYAVTLGKKENALLLDCAKLQHRYIPFELGEYRLLILNSNKPRSLITSKYNERKSECELALKKFKTVHHQLQHLCEADMSSLNLISDEKLKRRVRHVISENLRVKEAAKVLQHNDLSTFGRLMNASHASLKNDYEVTGAEMDTLAEEAQKIKGCLGARITGGGFGGCAIALVHQQMTDEFVEKIAEKYFSVTGINCSVYTCNAGEGVYQMA